MTALVTVQSFETARVAFRCSSGETNKGVYDGCLVGGVINTACYYACRRLKQQTASRVPGILHQIDPSRGACSNH